MSEERRAPVQGDMRTKWPAGKMKRGELTRRQFDRECRRIGRANMGDARRWMMMGQAMVDETYRPRRGSWGVWVGRHWERIVESAERREIEACEEWLRRGEE